MIAKKPYTNHRYECWYRCHGRHGWSGAKRANGAWLMSLSTPTTLVLPWWRWLCVNRHSHELAPSRSALYPSTRFNRAERVNAPWLESCMTLVAVATTATISTSRRRSLEDHAPVTMTRPQYAAKAIAPITSALRCARRRALEISAMVGMINCVEVDAALAPADVRFPP